MSEDKPEVVYGRREQQVERSVDELKALLRENNALLRQYGPALQEFKDRVETMPQTKRGLGDYMGQALVSGKFDGLIEALGGTLRPRKGLVNPGRRKRR